MKKFILTAVIMVAAAGMCRAQWYVGGGIGYTSNKNAAEGETTNYRSFSVSPRIGYVFNDRVLAGLKLSYSQQRRYPWSDGKYVLNTGALAPYFRYNIVSVGNFTFGAETGILARYGKTADTGNRKESLFVLSLTVSPVISLGLNEHWWLETYMDLFSLTYNNSRVEEGNTNSRSDNVHFGLSGDDIFSLAALSFGVVYRF